MVCQISKESNNNPLSQIPIYHLTIYHQENFSWQNQGITSLTSSENEAWRVHFYNEFYCPL